MKTRNVMKTIARLLGSNKSKMYADSASMFNAQIESTVKKRYFLESSQFECSDGSFLNREYALKVITDNHIFKIVDFNDSMVKALNCFDNLEFLNSGALVLERSFFSYDAFITITKNCDRIYDNGYTACYKNSLNNIIYSFCEGDFVKIHCSTSDIFEKECKNHNEYYIKHEA